MFGLSMSDVGWVVLLVSGAASFWIGRTLSRRWQKRQRDKRDAAVRANESRQARRSRERAQRRH